MTETFPPSWPLRFVGGALCLDFINTLDRPGAANEREFLEGYGSLLTWSAARGLVGATAYAKLGRQAEAEPDAAAAVFRDALALRAAIRVLADAAADGADPASALSPLNRWLGRLATPPLIRPAEGRSGFAFHLPGDALDEPLRPVLWTLAPLLASDDFARLRRCQAQACDAVFLDHTANRSRIWCSDDICGNRERVRRAYQARRARKAP
ncbi:CGNR zinc finger [bacterium YEK0313]|nr:CGNR zinc finger [bacterium YEK0313]